MNRLLSFAIVPALLALSACTDPATTEDPDTIGTIDEAVSQGRYIVGFREDGPGRVALLKNNGKVLLELSGLGAVAVTLPHRLVPVLQADPAIEFVEVDDARYPMSQTTPYGIAMVQADQVWPTTQGGAKKVCVIDSGLNVNHEDLAGNTFTGYASGTGNWYEDGCGHGTHVTGTIAAQNNTLGVVGVNIGGVQVHMVKVFDSTCGWTYSSTLIDAAERCYQAGANVISMSLGGNFKSRAEDKEFQKLWNAGIISVAAAGNAGTTRMSYPASYSSVISVAAVDSAKALATFSQRNREVDIAAPGVGVLSTLSYNQVATATVNGATYNGSAIDGAATTQSGVSGALADGGLCTAAGSWSGKVVLCQRGTTTFAEKVAAVVAGGGVAAVIYNNVSGGFLATLNGSSTIPAITLSMEDGQAIVAGGGVGRSTSVVSYIQSPGSGYAAWDGTSMATPHVSGVAALIWSAYPTKTNAQVRAALESTAQDLGDAGRDNSFGNGLVQAKAALDYLGSH